MSHDYSDYVEPTSEDSLAELSRLADLQLEAQVEVERAKAALKDREKELREIAEVRIPELMEEMGIETFTTTSGVKISVKEAIRASILVANKGRAFRWLRDNGHEALIKRIVKLQFGMGQDEQAQEAIDRLGPDYDIDDDCKVEPMTLKKFVREMLEEGQEVPEDLFSVHRQRVSNIKV